MKKLLALLLALAMVISLAACGGNTDPTEPDPTEAQTGKPTEKNETDPTILDSEDLEDLEDALDKLEDLMPEGWDENKYGAYIYEVWDSEFLPDCFPEPPEGIDIDQTTFKDYDHDTLNGDYSVGPLTYESYEEYREYGVGFYATQEQLDAFVAAVEAKGMTGGQIEDGEWCIYEYFGGGWYMEIFANLMHNDKEYDYWVSVDATDDLFDLPQSISGIPLPQCGFVSYDYSKYFTIQDFSDGYEDVDFNLSGDTLPTEYYAAWLNYYCATNQDAIDYARQLKDLGWEVEWESDSEDGYRCCLHKDGIYAVSNYYSYDGVLEVGFSDMIENLSY